MTDCNQLFLIFVLLGMGWSVYYSLLTVQLLYRAWRERRKRERGELWHSWHGWH